MDVVGLAPGLIGALFEDEGRAILREAGLGETWAEVLAHVPPEILAVQSEDPGLMQLAVLRDFWSRREELRPAIAATKALLKLYIERAGHAHPDTLVELGALGALAQRAGKVEEGAQLLERSYEDLRAVTGTKDLRLAVVAANLALHHVRMQDFARAEGLLDTAWRIRSQVAPQTTAQIAAQLGEVRVKLGKQEAAAPLYKEAWEKTKAQLGPDHARTVTRARVYGVLLNAIGHHGLAVAPLRVALDFARKRGDADVVSNVAFELGVALDAVGEREEGLRLIEEAVRTTRAAMSGGVPHPSLAPRLSTYATLQLARGRATEAEGLLREALEAERLLYGDDSAEVAARYAQLGYYHARAGRTAEALGWLDPAASLMRSAVGDEDPRTRAIVDYQVALLLAQAEAAINRRDRRLAGDMLRRAWSLALPVLGHSDRKVLKIRDLAAGLGLAL